MKAVVQSPILWGPPKSSAKPGKWSNPGNTVLLYTSQNCTKVCKIAENSK